MDPDIPQLTPFEDDGGLPAYKEHMIGQSLFSNTPVKLEELESSKKIQKPKSVKRSTISKMQGT